MKGYKMKEKENQSISWFWGLIALIIFFNIGKKITSKPYHSDVYSSWEEERIDELECDMAYIMDKLEKKH